MVLFKSEYLKQTVHFIISYNRVLIRYQMQAIDDVE